MNDTILDMRNRVTTEELDRLVRHQLTRIFAHPEQTDQLPPLMIWGAPGIGKSSIIRREQNLHPSGMCGILKQGCLRIESRRW